MQILVWLLVSAYPIIPPLVAVWLGLLVWNRVGPPHYDNPNKYRLRNYEARMIQLRKVDTIQKLHLRKPFHTPLLAWGFRDSKPPTQSIQRWLICVDGMCPNCIPQQNRWLIQNMQSVTPLRCSTLAQLNSWRWRWRERERELHVMSFFEYPSVSLEHI